MNSHQTIEAIYQSRHFLTNCFRFGLISARTHVDCIKLLFKLKMKLKMKLEETNG